MISENIINLIALIWIAIAVLLFPLLLFVVAPYGRHAKRSWGLMINNKLGWFFMEAPTLGVFTCLILYFNKLNNLIVITALFLWVFHYFHRVIIYPLRIRTRHKKMPVLIMCMAIFFNLINAFLNGYWLSFYANNNSEYAFFNCREIMGILIFIIGFVINKYHDRILIHLRKNLNEEYKVPQGGLFKYVSCPNFLGEMIEWAGFAILTWGLAPLSFFIWTVVNLLPRAIHHHKWYLSNFKNYPDKRKALIPFVL